MSDGSFLGGFINELANQAETHRAETRKREDDEIARRRGYIETIYKQMQENGTGDPSHYAQALKDIYTLSETQGAKRPRAKGRAGFGGATDMSQAMTPFLDAILNGDIDLMGGMVDPQAAAAPAQMPPPPNAPNRSAGDDLFGMKRGTERVGGTRVPNTPFNGIDLSAIMGSAKAADAPTTGFTPIDLPQNLQVPPPQVRPQAAAPLAPPPTPKPFAIKDPRQKQREEDMYRLQLQNTIQEQNRQAEIQRRVNAGQTLEDATAAVAGVEPTKFTQTSQVIPWKDSPTGYAEVSVDQTGRKPPIYTPAPAPKAPTPTDLLDNDRLAIARVKTGRNVQTFSDLTAAELAGVEKELQERKQAAAAAGRSQRQSNWSYEQSVKAGNEFMTVTKDYRKGLSQADIALKAYDSYVSHPPAARGPLQESIISTFKKVLDPDSAVRNEEYLRSSQGQSFAVRLRSIDDRLRKGGELADSEIDEIAKTIRLFKESYRSWVLDNAELVRSRVASAEGDLRTAIPPSYIEILDEAGAERVVGKAPGSYATIDNVVWVRLKDGRVVKK